MSSLCTPGMSQVPIKAGGVNPAQGGVTRTRTDTQLATRESLRDIEACLRAQQKKLYQMGIRGTVAKSNLADANEQRAWRGSPVGLLSWGLGVNYPRLPDYVFDIS